MNDFSADDIGTGRALTVLIHWYAAAILHDAYEVGEWVWMVQLRYNAQTLEAQIAAFNEPDAVTVISALWGMTEYASSPNSDDREHWKPTAVDCKRVFGNEFGRSPKLPIEATFSGANGEVWRVIQVRDRDGKIQRAIAEVTA